MSDGIENMHEGDGSAASVGSRTEVTAPVPSLPTVKRIEAEVAKLSLDVFIRPASAPAGLTAQREGKHQELIPGLKGWLGTLVSRNKPAAETAVTFIPESSAIADRISRDFGLLGGSEAL